MAAFLVNGFATAVTKSISVLQLEERGGMKRKTGGPLVDFESIASEVRRFTKERGQEGVMPRMGDLRSNGRVDLEKAIAKLGGFEEVASRMNLRMTCQRKPKHYWSSLSNVMWEVTKFQEDYESPPEYMPSRRALQEAGRYDLARALEKWGGLREVARLLGLKVRRTSRSHVKPDSSMSVTVPVSSFFEQKDRGTHSSYSADLISPSFPITKQSNTKDKRGVVITGKSTSGKFIPVQTSKTSLANDEDLTDTEGEGPRPMKAPLPASSRKWMNLKKSEGREEHGDGNDS